MAAGWPKGVRRGPQSAEHRARISASVRQHNAELRPWVEMTPQIMAAVNSGDKDLASELFHAWLDERQSETEAVAKASGVGLLDQVERRAIVRDQIAALDEVFAETQRLRAEREAEEGRGVRPGSTHTIIRGNPHSEPAAKFPRPSLTGRQRQLNAMFNLALPVITDAEAEKIAKDLREAMSGIGEPDPTYDPYDHIGPAQRARNQRAIRAAADQRHGFSGAATVPYVGPNETRHPPMTGTHQHDHGAHNHPDHDDGIHTHIHSHANDADHNHEHELQPGRVGQTGQ